MNKFLIVILLEIVILVGMVMYVVEHADTHTATKYPYTKRNLKACQQLRGEVVIRVALNNDGTEYMTCELIYPEVVEIVEVVDVTD